MSYILIVMVILLVCFFILSVFAMAKSAGDADREMEEIYRKMHDNSEK